MRCAPRPTCAMDGLPPAGPAPPPLMDMRGLKAATTGLNMEGTSGLPPSTTARAASDLVEAAAVLPLAATAGAAAAEAEGATPARPTYAEGRLRAPPFLLRPACGGGGV